MPSAMVGGFLRAAPFSTSPPWVVFQSPDALRLAPNVQTAGVPCEVYLSDYQKVDGRLLPQRMEFVNSDKNYATFTTITYTLKPSK